MDKVDHFKGNEERNGNKVHESDEPDSCLEKDLDGQRLLLISITWIQIPVLRALVVGPDGGGHSSDDTQAQLEQHSNQNVVVGGFGNL